MARNRFVETRALEYMRQGDETFLTTKVDSVLNWGRKYSMFLYPFVTACCGMEFMSVAGPRYDIDRFGCALPRFSPRQADLLMVVGTISPSPAGICRAGSRKNHRKNAARMRGTMPQAHPPVIHQSTAATTSRLTP